MRRFGGALSSVAQLFSTSAGAISWTWTTKQRQGSWRQKRNAHSQRLRSAENRLKTYRLSKAARLALSPRVSAIGSAKASPSIS